jgi:hypothetical protein
MSRTTPSKLFTKSPAPKTVYVRRAKNDKLDHETVTGSIRDRAFGGGWHAGKPVFAHGTREQWDATSKAIGKRTKAKKKKKAQKRALQIK